MTLNWSRFSPSVDAHEEVRCVIGDLLKKAIKPRTSSQSLPLTFLPSDYLLPCHVNKLNTPKIWMAFVMKRNYFGFAHIDRSVLTSQWCRQVSSVTVTGAAEHISIHTQRVQTHLTFPTNDVGWNTSLLPMTAIQRSAQTHYASGKSFWPDSFKPLIILDDERRPLVSAASFSQCNIAKFVLPFIVVTEVVLCHMKRCLHCKCLICIDVICICSFRHLTWSYWQWLRHPPWSVVSRGELAICCDDMWLCLTCLFREEMKTFKKRVRVIHKVELRQRQRQFIEHV